MTDVVLVFMLRCLRNNDGISSRQTSQTLSTVP